MRSRTFLTFSLIALAASAVGALLAAPCGSTEPIDCAKVTLKAATFSGTASMVEYAEFANPSSPSPKKYRKKAVSGTMNFAEWPASYGTNPLQYPLNYNHSETNVNIPGIPFGVNYVATLEPIERNGDLIKYRCRVSDGAGDTVHYKVVAAADPFQGAEFHDGDEKYIDSRYGPYSVGVWINYVYWQPISSSGALMGARLLDLTRDEWDIAREWPADEVNHCQRYQGPGASMPLSGGTPVAAPANFFSINGPSYGAGVQVNAAATTRTTTGTETPLLDTTNNVYRKFSGTVTETLTEEDTEDDAEKRVEDAWKAAHGGLVWNAPANFAPANFPVGPAYRTSRGSGFSWNFNRIAYEALIDISCEGEYDVVVTYSTKPHGAGSATGKDVQIRRQIFKPGNFTVKGEIRIKEKDVDYTLENIEVRRPCGQIPPGAVDFKVSSVHVEMSLGLDVAQTSAGYLGLTADTITAALYTPAALHAATPDGVTVEIVRDAAGAIRQLRAPQALADVATLDGSSYEVRFFAASDVGARDPVTGIYAVAGSPFVAFKFENPDAAAGLTKGLRVTETRGANVRVHEYSYASATNAWTLATGNNLRKEEQVITVAGADTTKVITIREGDGTARTKTAKTYHTFAWGQELVSEILDPDGAALATSYVFYSNVGTDGANYGRLKSTTNPDGSWMRRTYDAAGRVLQTVRPYLNSAITDADNLSRVTSNSYTSLGDADGDGLAEQLTTTVELTYGNETSRSYTVDWSKPVALGGENFTRRSHVRCAVAGAAWNASTNGVTETLEYSSGPFTGRERRVVHPDGSIVLTSSTIDSGGQTTTTVKSGAPNGTWDDIVAGTTVVTTINPSGQICGSTTYDVASGLFFDGWVASAYDSLGRPTRLDYTDGTYELRGYACCGLSSSRDRLGVTTTYDYDALGRQTHQTRDGITRRTAYDADGRVKSLTRIGTDASEMVQETTNYDLAGRRNEHRDALNRLTAYAETYDAGTGQTTRTTTNPDGGTVIEVRARDGSALSTSGTAAAPRTVEYSFDAGKIAVKEISVGEAGATTEWRQTVQNLLGNVEKVVYPGTAVVAQNFYNAAGQLIRQTDPEGVSDLLGYNAQGEQEIVARDRNGNGVIDYDGTDQITRTRRSVATHGSFVVQRTTTEVWETDNSDTPVTVAVSEVTADGLHAWQTERGLTTTTATVLDGSGGRTVTITAPDGVKTVQVFANDRLVSTTVRTAAEAQLAATTNAYDPQGRLQSSTDARNGSTTFDYYADDQLHTVTTPDPDPAHSGVGYDAQVTTYSYDGAGRVSTVTQADGGVVNTTYWPTGAVKRTWGSRTYPAEYTYDPQGRAKTLTTWQDFATDAGKAVTTWNYDAARGWLANKRYADNSGPSYTYRPAGRLQTRSWARGTVTTYDYTGAGELKSVDYSDGTPDVTLGYDRLGRPKTITDGTGSRTLDYAGSDQLHNEDYTAGALAGYGIHRTFDAQARLESLTAVSASSTLHQVGYSYDAASRLDTVTAGSNTATYGYLANSSLVESITGKQGGSTRLTGTRSYDYLNRLQSISSQPSAPGSQLVSFAYSYNSANQRTRTVREDNAYWSYGYDALGQVTSAGKKLASDVPVAGFQSAYTYDDIGNRKTATSNAQSSTYTATLLNSYSTRTVPGAIDITGAAATGATVTVSLNGGAPQTTSRQGESFFKQVGVDNSAAPQFPAVGVTGATNNAGPAGEDAVTTVTRHPFVPQNPESFTYDADGNLTDDARWHYTWDGENRLVALETSTGAANAGVPRRKLEFTYDQQGRRYAKKVFDWSGSAWTQASFTRFLYDGWNLLAELDAAAGNAVIRTHTWGTDLSGSFQGAGGVGGLLFSATTGTGASTYAAAYDGNGNVMTYVDLSTGATVVVSEYGAFGETLRTDGPLAGVLPLGFSTKYADADSALFYYGLRYYNPSSGRWLNRDPLGERGGINLMSFVSNDGTNHFDILGLALKPYVMDVYHLPWIYDDLSKRGKGAVTDRNWPDSVATASGTKVTIEGELHIQYFIHDNNSLTPDSKGIDKLSFREHEGFHATIAKTLWNANMSQVNQWEGVYCNEKCASLAAAIANQTNLLNQAIQEANNHGFDVQQYGSNEAGDANIRERNQAAADRGTADIEIYRRNVEKLTKEFEQSGCSRPKK